MRKRMAQNNRISTIDYHKRPKNSQNKQGTDENRLIAVLVGRTRAKLHPPL